MEQNQTLQDFLNIPHDSREYKRALAVHMVESGMPPKDIARILDVSRAFISKWRKIFHHEGINGFRLKHRGGISYLSEEERQKTLTWIVAQELCTPVMLRTYVEETFGISYESPQSYYALLKEAGLRYKKAQTSNPKKTQKPWQPNTPRYSSMLSPIGMIWNEKNESCFL